MAQPQPFQLYLDMRTRVNQGNFADRFIQIQRQARQAFTDFNPEVTPPGQIPPATFAYIGRFVHFDQQVNAIRGHQDLVPANQLPANQQAEARRILERVGRVEALRNILREYLLQGGFADNQQLQGPHPGYNNQVPRRFRYAEQGQYQNYQIATEMVSHYLHQVQQLLQQCPTAHQFGAIRTTANHSLTQFQQNPQQQPGAALFNYINHFQTRNERFEQLEFRIEAGLDLLQRIEYELPTGVMSEDEKTQVHAHLELFIRIRIQRGMSQMHLIQSNLATEDQLTFGYKGGLPPAFQVQPQEAGQGQVQPHGVGQGQVQPAQGRGRGVGQGQVQPGQGRGRGRGHAN